MDTAALHSLQQIAEQCVCSHSRQVSRTLTRLYDKALAPAGIKMTQFTILVAIGLHGKATVTQLATAQKIEHTTLTRTIALLQKNGFVELQSDKNDRRLKHIKLTPKSEQTLAIAYPLWQKVQELVASKVETNFVNDLETLIQKLEEQEGVK